jgi:hypothetical protein
MLDGDAWSHLLLCARAANLSGTLAKRVLDLPQSARLPSRIRSHLIGVRRLGARQMDSVKWEALTIAETLAAGACPIIALKGSAYVLAGLPVCQGRLFGDIDILVPAERLGVAESRLMLSGWISANRDAYDQRYYRRWMHELPPMTHIRRQTVLDIHHTIVPPTSRCHPDPARLWEASHEVAGFEPLRVLSNHDMVLHSATHLFFEGELHNGLRDLVDLDALLRDFGVEPQFWRGLPERAATLELTRPLYYALRYTAKLLGTPVPDDVMHRLAGARPPAPVEALMDALYDRAFRPDHASCADALTPLAKWLLYIRGHWLRMPPYLLVYHLTRKAVSGLKREDSRA